jgi:hypothetical protein
MIDMAEHDKARQERSLHDRMEWFFKKHAPADKREAAEFHADLVMVIQAVHQDASRETHRLLQAAIALMPSPFTVLRKPDGSTELRQK